MVHKLKLVKLGGTTIAVTRYKSIKSNDLIILKYFDTEEDARKFARDYSKKTGKETYVTVIKNGYGFVR